MKKPTLALALLSALVAAAAHAQEMPAPRSMPRTPVSREALAEKHDVAPPSRQVQGSATILDGEKLRIGETDLRLFGVVPPQLSASFGPQARSILDLLTSNSTIVCQIRDRDRDGRLLATCRNANGADLALELLKRGLAVTARGSLAETEFAAPYAAAEQSAQFQKIGLWSVTSVAPASATIAPSPAPSAPPLKADAPQPPPPAEAPKKEEKAAAPKTDKTAEAQTQAKIAADLLAQQDAGFETPWPTGEDKGFFERYQNLIAGLLMLTTAVGVTGALWAQKSRDRREETRAVAAALRGELMAARAVCLGRAKSITDEASDLAATWPRIRSTLYQAYVGRIGILGAELSRLISSLYGQLSDYGALYSTTAAATTVPKKHALEMLARRIDDMMPRLADIERTGSPPKIIAIHVPRGPLPMTLSHAPGTPVTHTEPSALPGPQTGDETPTPSEPSTATEAASTEPSAPPAAAQTAAAAAAPAPTATTSAHTPGAHAAQAFQAAQAAPAALRRATLALWESVSQFIQNHRNQNTATQAIDPQMAEYAAMIEADMARYQQYGESIEPLDVTPPQKKRG